MPKAQGRQRYIPNRTDIAGEVVFGAVGTPVQIMRSLDKKLSADVFFSVGLCLRCGAIQL
ncbi:hypothetical protein [Celeribacter sp.]|uniref:hypothetical protein n=1 Tax=Celeribacter sp. TaxID=1890673 RepID=UPI003A8E9642